MAKKYLMIDYSLDRPTSDTVIEEAHVSRPGKSIKLRVQPQVLMRRPPDAERDVYYAWKGVHWKLECETVEEAHGVRAALAGLFAAIGTVGSEKVLEVLDTLLKNHVESAASAGVHGTVGQ
jgi:hypothetical protein